MHSATRALRVVPVAILLLLAGCLSDGQLGRLRQCESHGNYSAVSASGTYRGAYQFSRSTWDHVATASYPPALGQDPAAADPVVQDLMARALYRQSGAGQ